MKSVKIVAAVLTLSLLVGLSALTGAEVDRPGMRKRAGKHMTDGNWKDAYNLFSKLSLDIASDARLVTQDFSNALHCLGRLNRINEVDEFREKVVALHKDNWRMLRAVATSYNNIQHYGYMVAGKYHRGHHRGGGRYVNSWERDRIRSLQLMNQAIAKTQDEKSVTEVASFYLSFADYLMTYRGYRQGWRLQYLSDLSELPDYEKGYGYYYGRGRTKGAPVDEKGDPVFHYMPKSWKAATTDGQRWRWLLMQAMELDRQNKSHVLRRFANFLKGQFGVQTMASYGRLMGRGTGEKDDKDGPFLVHTLAEDETIARLATGVKRFKLPDEFNYIRIFKELDDNNSASVLGGIFENRRQYSKAVVWWRKVGNVKRVEQIIGNWGGLQATATFPAGKGASLLYRFRNGSKVNFVAHSLDVRKLLDDVKKYIKSKPPRLKWDHLNISNIGWRIVSKGQKKYIRAKVAEWSLDLKPRQNHWDSEITVATPLQKAGAYLLIATMENGNVSRIVVWVNDTVLVRKPLKDKVYFFVADAVSGKPVAGANLEFFGYRTKWNRSGKNYTIYTDQFAEKAGEDGQLLLDPKEASRNFSWLTIATAPGGRLAYMGFNGIWHGYWYDREYSRNRIFGITDRPVYRPGNKMKFKFWYRYAKYDLADKSYFAGTVRNIIIYNPKGEKIYTKALKCDDYGGLDGEIELPSDAVLGMYRVTDNTGANISFRVEEYKKPEFEVKIEAPDEPVALGEKIEARIVAKYYFGAPVTKAKVKYKVLRYEHDARWYPEAPWDWYYGRGYWWFAYDYSWYPGWSNWGCMRPRWSWWGRWSPVQPEVVAEGEAAIGEDGVLKVNIDTALTKAVHGDKDHRYEITAEVRDESRRTIVGSGKVLVARKPFKVYTWVDRGHYRVGDTVEASFSAQTLDGKPVKGSGKLVLYRVTYDKDSKPVEKAVGKWQLDPGVEGRARQQIKASRPGQYRLSYSLTDTKKHTIEGGYVFVVRGEGTDGREFRFNHLEIVTDKKEYAPGEKIRLMVNTDRVDSTVALFLRPANGCYLAPELIRFDGKSIVREVAVSKKDMPNFFIEVMTISGGKVHSEVREVIVPPEKRILNVEVLPSALKYKPGQKGKIKVKLTDFFGKPYVGSTVLSVYDKSVEYISGGSNVAEIKSFFWKWRRSHRINTRSSLQRYFNALYKNREKRMAALGVFGHMLMAGGGGQGEMLEGQERGASRTRGNSREIAKSAAAPSAADGAAPGGFGLGAKKSRKSKEDSINGAGGKQPEVQPTVRTKFADTALWVASLITGKDGIAEVDITMPENLTGWKIRVWGMGHGTRVGQGEAEVVTAKDLMLRMQAPRFFVEKDEVVLSANVHNYLKVEKEVRVILELDGPCLKTMSEKIQVVKIPAGGEKRVDWRVKVGAEGQAVVRMKALTDVESDAMEMRFPALVHGMDKMVPKCGVIRGDANNAVVTFNVPKQRRINASRLEIRYSPTLAGAMVDALPYLMEYPYGCTEQTLNRFLPTVISQRILLKTGLKLSDIRDKITNLNAQELGDDKQRAAQWRKRRTYTWGKSGKRLSYNPVFDEAVVASMVKSGVRRLTNMQLSDGGWGWFSGYREHSYAHTTAYVIHGLQVAVENDVAIVPGVIKRGVTWLQNYEKRQIRLIRLWESSGGKRGKPKAGNLDAFVFMVLVDAGHESTAMREYLYRDRNSLAVYAKSMLGIALHKKNHKEQLAMIMKNIEQYLVQDDENQTAYLKLGNGNYWWYWYGSEYEAQAYYLKLLSRVDPKGQKAPRLVKYLLNNRKHASYWNSTRDTALCIEAFADYMKASGEDVPDMTVEILVDGKKMKEVKINKENLFSFDNKLVLIGDAVESGEHKIELRRKGSGSLYFNAYLSYFSLEDYIKKAGLEVKVERKYYRLVKVAKTVKDAGSRGQVLNKKVEKYKRVLMKDLETLKSGEMVEVELEIASKNDYEYLIFEDMKPAGFETVEVRSGYNGNDLNAYVEFRDTKVSFFVRTLARGKHSVSYRMRAEIPGKFSALPAKAYAMYAPELRANSDEIKIKVVD
jgi:alpha-2-macroglobulin